MGHDIYKFPTSNVYTYTNRSRCDPQYSHQPKGCPQVVKIDPPVRAVRPEGAETGRLAHSGHPSSPCCQTEE